MSAEKLQPDTSSDAEIFGVLIREKRKARGWNQENLADAAFSNADRKGYVSQIENGKVPNITRDTVRNVVRALNIDLEEIPPSLRWPEASEVVKDTNTVAHEIQKQVDKLVVSEQERARQFSIHEDLLIALAQRYAENSPENFEAALAALGNGLEVAKGKQDKGDLPSDIPDAVSAIVAQAEANTAYTNTTGAKRGGLGAITTGDNTTDIRLRNGPSILALSIGMAVIIVAVATLLVVIGPGNQATAIGGPAIVGDGNSIQ